MVSGLLTLNPEPQNLNPKPYSLAESLLRVLGLRAYGCLSCEGFVLSFGGQNP